MFYRRIRWIMPLVVLLLCGAGAHADDFKTHYDLAVALYQAQKYEEAIPEFKAAYDLDPRPGLLFNLAQSYRKAGHLREAIQYYDRYLTSDPRIDTDTRRKVDGYLAETRNTLAALELEMKQRLAEEKAAREHETQAARPEPAQAPSLVKPEPPVPPSPPPPPPPPGLVAVEPRPQPKPIYRRWWFWTAVGGAVAVGAIVGIAVGVTQAKAAPEVPSGVPIGPLTF